MLSETMVQVDLREKVFGYVDMTIEGAVHLTTLLLSFFVDTSRFLQ